MPINIQKELASIELGDVRRHRRVARLAARLAQSPSASLRAAAQGWAEAMAGYRLLHRNELDPQKVLEAHHQAVLERAATAQSLLLVQDTSELDYSAHQALQGSGPLSDPSRRGFFLHAHLLIAEEEALVLGVCKAQVWARADAEHGKAQQRKRRPIEEKETMRWLRGYEDACALAGRLTGQEIIMVADREADIYELYARWQQRAQSGRPCAGFMVRASQRALAEGQMLFEKLHAAPLLGSDRVEIERKEKSVKIQGNRHRRVRESRLATLEVRAALVRLRPPWRPGFKLPEVALRAVLVCEKDPPVGQEPIQWVLLRTLPVESFAQAQRIVRAYTLRWLIEEFHRVLKSGCRVEALLLREGRALLAAVALYMVVAWRILYLRDLSRACATMEGSFFFTEAECRALGVIFPWAPGRDPPSLEKLTLLVARLGGDAARKNDPAPGAECLWRGLEKLRCYVEMGQALGAL